jgi:hypothetical protein
MTSPAIRSTVLPLAGFACFAGAVAALHFLQPESNPLTEAVSYYAHGRGGPLLTAGLLALGGGSLLLLGGPLGGGSSAGRTFLAIWGVGAMLGGIFPADPPGNWDKPPSTPGMIHAGAAMIAFLALPVGALLLRKPLASVVPAASPLAVAAAVSLAVFFASLAPAIVTSGPPWMLGLTERVLLTLYVAWLAAAALANGRAT